MGVEFLLSSIHQRVVRRTHLARPCWRLTSVLKVGKSCRGSGSRPGDAAVASGSHIISQGSRDKAVPELFAQRASALIPQSKVNMVDSGHFIPLNNPEVVAELLRFLRGSRGCVAQGDALSGGRGGGWQEAGGWLTCLDDERTVWSLWGPKRGHRGRP